MVSLLQLRRLCDQHRRRVRSLNNTGSMFRGRGVAHSHCCGGKKGGRGWQSGNTWQRTERTSLLESQTTVHVMLWVSHQPAVLPCCGGPLYIVNHEECEK